MQLAMQQFRSIVICKRSTRINLTFLRNGGRDIKSSMASAGRVRKASSSAGLGHVFTRVIDKLADDYLPRNAGDFRLIDKRCIDLLKQV